MTTFCAEHGLSRKTFYAIRARVATEGRRQRWNHALVAKGPARTRSSTRVKEQALGVRAALESSGLDHGPISVHDKMWPTGMCRTPPLDSHVCSMGRSKMQVGTQK